MNIDDDVLGEKGLSLPEMIDRLTAGEALVNEKGFIIRWVNYDYCWADDSAVSAYSLTHHNWYAV